MGITNICIRLLLIFSLLSFPVFSQEKENTENYLIGMSVSKSFANNYEIRIKLKNETDNSYKLKNLGNNSYAMVLPQVKSLITEDDIFYEDEHDDIKIVISENKDLTDNNFYTKLNFKTKDDRLIHVDAYAIKSLKPQVVLAKTPEEVQNSQDNSLPDWIWYLPVGILSLLCILLMLKPTDDDIFDKKSSKKHHKIDKQNIEKDNDTENNTENDTERNNKNQNNSYPLHKDNNQINLSAVTSYLKTNNKNSETKNDSNSIQDNPSEQKIVNEKNKTETKKFTIDLYDTKNTKSAQNRKIIKIPHNMTLSERLRNKDIITEAEDIIFSEKEIFFANISPINDIPINASEIHSKEKPETENNQNDLLTPAPAKISPEQEDYEKLLESFKKVLTIAHKIKPDEEEQTPDVEIVDSFSISDYVGFSLVKFGDKVSLTGHIKHNVFVIKTFEQNEIKDENLFMEFCTQTPFSATYSVILNKFKALVKVTENDISLIGEYN